jgi:hypothetical protein
MASMPSHPQEKNRRVANQAQHRRVQVRYAAILLAAIDFLANIAAVGGLITSHADVIIITTAVLGILGGLYLFLKQWNRPVNLQTALAVAIIVGGSVVFSLHYEPAGPTTSDGSDGTSAFAGGPASGSTTRGDGKPVGKDGDHGLVFENEFTLAGGEGLELDDEKGTVMAQQAGAAAPVDVFMSSYGLIYSTENFFLYESSKDPSDDTDEFTYCKNLMAVSQLNVEYLSASDIRPGVKYCTQTTRGRVALVSFVEMIDGGGEAARARADFTVKLWG